MKSKAKPKTTIKPRGMLPRYVNLDRLISISTSPYIAQKRFLARARKVKPEHVQVGVQTDCPGPFSKSRSVQTIQTYNQYGARRIIETEPSEIVDLLTDNDMSPEETQSDGEVISSPDMTLGEILPPASTVFQRMKRMELRGRLEEPQNQLEISDVINMNDALNPSPIDSVELVEISDGNILGEINPNRNENEEVWESSDRNNVAARMLLSPIRDGIASVPTNIEHQISNMFDTPLPNQTLLMSLSMSMSPEVLHPQELVTLPEESDTVAVQQMCIQLIDKKAKFNCMIGVNAWKEYLQKRSERIGHSENDKNDFKEQLHEMDTAQLNRALCSFINEHRGPNDSGIGIDYFYYMLLGMQKSLNVFGRDDNIFYDPSYMEFREAFDNLAHNYYLAKAGNATMVFTVVTEDFLWTTKQLGPHSPNVLLNTMLYFNTKYFQINSMEQHKQLSFNDVRKHWKHYMRAMRLNLKRTLNDSEVTSQHSDVYMLYKIYISKCPMRRQGKSPFYRMPLVNISPESEIEFTAQPLSETNMQQMLHRINMVQEIIICNMMPMMQS